MRKRAINFDIKENGCFVVTSHRLNKEGYALYYNNKKEERMHRFVYKECFGEIPDGMLIRHKCDNPSCINPEHLELGTHIENKNDAVVKERHAFGERNGRAFLTNNDVFNIKKMLSDGMRVCDVSRNMKISYTIVSRIKRGLTWKLVNEPTQAVKEV